MIVAHATTFASEKPPPARSRGNMRALRIVILGGTGFVGRHLVAAAASLVCPPPAPVPPCKWPPLLQAIVHSNSEPKTAPNPLLARVCDLERVLCR